MSNAERRARKQENKRHAQQERYSQWAAQRRKYRARRFAPVIVVLVAGLVVGGVLLVTSGDDSVSFDDCPDKEANTDDKEQYTAAPEMGIGENDTFRATLETSEGTMVAELDAAQDAVTVNNFVFLACEGFYDRVVFHRVIEGFMIQGGDPQGNGTGGPGYTFTGGTPDSAYKVGDIVMANGGDPSSNGSQFFIVTGPQGESLPPNYSRFGKLVEGVKVAKKISRLQDIEKTDPQGGVAPPKRRVVIENVTVEEV